MSFKQQITEQLKKTVQDLGLEVIPTVDYPVDAKHGDYATNVSLVAAKKAGKNPRELAEEIVKDLKVKNEENGLFQKIEIAGPGFINFWIKEQKFIEAIDLLRNNKDLFDIVKDDLTDKKVIVEYSSPNIAKPFTVGHLRSTIIGDAIANLLEVVGYTVFRDNHVGDWGTQFGKQIYAIKTWGNEESIEKSDRPVKELVLLYVKFHEEAEKDPSLEDEARAWFKKLEEGDSEARRLWQKCIDWSWKEFNTIYQQLGVTFTENGGRGYGESFFEDKMDAVIEELKSKQLLKEGKEGAKIVAFPDETKFPPLMILKKDGATLYSTRDLATDTFRLFDHKEYGKDVLIINEVGIEQTLYFRQLYNLEEMLGWVKPGQRVHVAHGHYRFKEGKMSTRKGNIILLEDVLAEAIKRAGILAMDKFNEQVVRLQNNEGGSMKTKGPAVTSDIGLGALKWNDLKRDAKQDISFDWDEILNMQGNSGPYMQYTYVRTKSVLEKVTDTTYTDFDFLQSNITLHVEEREVLRLLVRFSETIEEAAKRYAPHIVCTYLFDVAQAYNLFYQKHQILKAEGETRAFRLLLTQATGTVLQKGLNLLGIKTPEKM